jgi:hypothetical protein
MPILGSSASHGTSARLKPVVTGGTLTNDGTYYYRKFTANGNLGVSGASLTADTLVIAGGGAGGYRGGGGGGAGGQLYTPSVSLSPLTYTLTIGAGGEGTTSFAPSGNDSSISGTGFTTLTGTGGGGGSISSGGGNGGLYGASGGSGGGGNPIYQNAVSPSEGGAGIAGQGFAGADAVFRTEPNARSGGGGGAGGAATTQNGGPGSSTYSSWLSATGTGVSGSIAGGGGGGGGFGAPGTASGGGGAGSAAAYPNGYGLPGTANTGGGGGGGNYSGSQSGGSGGSGLIIIRYLMTAV